GGRGSCRAIRSPGRGSAGASPWRDGNLVWTRRNRLRRSLGFGCARRKTPSPALRAPSPRGARVRTPRPPHTAANGEEVVALAPPAAIFWAQLIIRFIGAASHRAASSRRYGL